MVFLVEKEEDMKTLKAVEKIHKVLNHKSKEQMLFAFRNASKLDGDTQKLIKIVTEVIRVCKFVKCLDPSLQWRYLKLETLTR